MTETRVCPVCSRNDGKELFHPQASPGTVVQCRQCGMVYIAKIDREEALIFDGPVVDAGTDREILTTSNIADIQNSWEYSLLPDKEAEWPALERNAQDALRRIEKQGGSRAPERRILDFGSGWGFFLATAKKQGWSAHGLEPLPACAAYARATFGVEVVTDTLRADSFPPASFDVVTSFQVFEHLPTPLENVCALHTMLKSGGLILIEVPNFDTWSMKLLGARHRHFVQDHLNFFSIATLSQLLARAGFEVVNSYHATRLMSMRHLVKHWLPKYLPFIARPGMQNAVASTPLWEMTMGFNLGDIIAVIGRKV